MKLVFRRVACFGLILILCFQMAFAPRAKAVAPLVLTAVAAVGVGGLAAAVAAYFKANGVDMTMYNIASGAAAQEAMSNLIQEYLDDTRDGMDIDDYVSSIGLADKVFYKYYKGAADWVAARVQTVISALGVATIFDPILNWFMGKYNLSDETLIYGNSNFSYVVYDQNNVTSNFNLFVIDDSLVKGQSYFKDSILNFGTIMYVPSLSTSETHSYWFSALGVKLMTMNWYSGNEGTNLPAGRFYNATSYNQSSSSLISKYVGNYSGTTTRWRVGLAYFLRSGDIWPIEFLVLSGNTINSVYSWLYVGEQRNAALSGLKKVGVSASQREDDGTNRFPSTSVPDDFQLVIPMEISNAGTVQPVPPSTDTQENQSDAITAAILDSQALNGLSLSETPSVEAEDAQPTAAPTAVPTAEPTTEPTVVPTAEPTLAPSIPEEYTPDITEIFPFCIPFDFYLLFDLFSAEPEAPHFTIPFPIPERIKVDSDGNFSGQYEYQQRQIEIDFRDKPELEAFMAVFRRGELILFVAGLALVTRKFIRW